MLDNFNDIDKINRQIYNEIDYNIKSETLMQRYPMIMDWLGLLDTNVYFIIGLMILISGITIISTLLILILEKTNFIGILKAMGTTTASIRRIFIYRSAGLILKGLVAGNIIGLGLAFLQDRFHIIPLDPESYYMNTVPVAINIPLIVVLNAVTLAVTLIMLLWPSSIISKISPVKAIRFE
jgi:lipoprotein-releasing system permease protein